MNTKDHCNHVYKNTLSSIRFHDYMQQTLHFDSNWFLSIINKRKIGLLVEEVFDMQLLEVEAIAAAVQIN